MLTKITPRLINGLPLHWAVEESLVESGKYRTEADTGTGTETATIGTGYVGTE